MFARALPYATRHLSAMGNAGRGKRRVVCDNLHARFSQHLAMRWRFSVATDDYYFDDLHVGQRFESGSHTITETEIKAFAAAFDPQPFHLDDECARGSVFGGLAASGWHTAAITMRLMVDLGIPAGGLIGTGCELSWPRPTRPGDTLHVTSEVLEITPSRSRNDRGTAVIRSETRNQRDEIVQQLTSRMVAFKRPTI
jgi:acyl dehydratase